MPDRKNIKLFSIKASFVLILFSLAFSVTALSQGKVSVFRIGESYPTDSAYVLGKGEQLSGQQFQTEGIMSFAGYQYTVYYNHSRNVCIARRKMPSGKWEEVILPYRNKADDAHNVITMGICANDGTIHLAYDHHNDPLHYSYSILGNANFPDEMPWTAASFSETTDVMDLPVPNVTYPRFIPKPDGNLLFECRFNWSGHGDSYLREYDGQTKKWYLIGRYVQGEDIEPDACAYINGMNYDKEGKLHVTWCWRDDYGGQTNHDLYYAYSDDNGFSWRDTYGDLKARTDYMVPETDKTTRKSLGQTKRSFMVEEIPLNKGYINQETQAVDSKGRIHVVNSHIPMDEGTDKNWASSRQKARLHHRYRDSDGTWQTRLIKNKGNTVNSFCRVNLSFDAFDNAYVVANGAEIYTATAANDYNDWELLSDLDKNRFISEPLVDKKLLLESGVLSFVYLGPDKKITVIDYLAKNPNKPNGKGLLVEYFSDKKFTKKISSEVSANTAGLSIPKKTKCIRISGTFETLLGEDYKLIATTKDEIKAIVNGEEAKFISKMKKDKGMEFSFKKIPSHKNTILIEAKTSKSFGLQWVSKSTAKSAIPSSSLYPN